MTTDVSDVMSINPQIDYILAYNWCDLWLLAADLTDALTGKFMVSPYNLYKIKIINFGLTANYTIWINLLCLMVHNDDESIWILYNLKNKQSMKQQSQLNEYKRHTWMINIIIYEIFLFIIIFNTYVAETTFSLIRNSKILIISQVFYR